MESTPRPGPTVAGHHPSPPIKWRWAEIPPSTATTAGGPFPEFGVNRNNFYGFVNRDFYSVHQDIGTLNGEISKLGQFELLSNAAAANNRF